ncbi:outer membrane beta-barrel protein [Flavitalea flava]
MEYLDDDMEELFRKAAQDYKVKLPDEQWDAVAGRLISGTGGLASVDTPDNKKKKRWPFLSGLMTGLFLAIFLFIGFYKDLGLHGGLVKKNALTGERDKRLMEKEGTLERTPGLATVKMMDPETKAGKKNSGTRMAGEGKARGTNGGNEKDGEEKGEGAEIGNEKGLGTGSVEKIEGQTKASKIKGLLAQRSEPRIIESRIIEPRVIGQTAPVNNHKKTVRNLINKRFYFGLIAGPQFNQVKNQGFSKPGLNAGLMVGFKVKPSLAFETGLIFSSKTYYSDGQYFSMSKIASAMPAGMKLIDMRGKATVLEIPVMVKIDIRKTNSSCLFIAGGVSSYLLIHENNAYQAAFNGAKESLTGNYSHTEKYLSAAINISPGYEFMITGKKVFRIQPYLQIPVKAIGVGALPILGAGINLGILIP